MNARPDEKTIKTGIAVASGFREAKQPQQQQQQQCPFQHIRDKQAQQQQPQM